MKKVLMMMVLPIALMLTSCADEFDVAMVERHMQAEIEIAKAKAAAITAQSEAIAITLDNESSDLERYLARQQIAGLVMTPSGLKSITTGNDVIMSITKDGKVIVRDIVTGAVVYRGIVGLTDALASAGNTNIAVDGEGNTVTTNREDVKQIVAGTDNSAGYKAGGGAAGSSELAGECDAKVEEALAGYDMNNINLGGLMRRLSAETGCVVEIVDEQVTVVDSGNPVSSMNSHYAGHKDLGGVEEVPTVEE